MGKLRVLDLFSGIGGFSLGLERTGGFETVAFCEIDGFCRKILTKHWPQVKQYEDIRTLTSDQLRSDGISVDAITAGFPCQDISIAGRGVGIDGPRSGLWREVMRLVGDLRPLFVILENVSKIRSRGLEILLAALAKIGYDAEWHCIPAAHVGAPHRRDRIWIIANRQKHALSTDTYGVRLYPSQMHIKGSVEFCHEQERNAGSLAWWSSEPTVERVVDGVPTKLDVARIRAIGNAVVPFIPEMIGLAILSGRAALSPENGGENHG